MIRQGGIESGRTACGTATDEGDDGIDYCVLVDRALFADCYTLDDFPVLSELPLVVRWAEAHQRDLLPRGKALHVLLRRAVADVVACAPEGDACLAQVADFARLRYQERLTVSAIARRWGMHRRSLYGGCTRRALELVTRRVLQLAHGGQWQSVA